MFFLYCPISAYNKNCQQSPTTVQTSFKSSMKQVFVQNINCLIFALFSHKRQCHDSHLELIQLYHCYGRGKTQKCGKVCFSLLTQPGCTICPLNIQKFYWDKPTNLSKVHISPLRDALSISAHKYTTITAIQLSRYVL